MTDAAIAAAVEAVRAADVVTVLTGAGMSAESGVPTFRDVATGVWAKYDPMTVATPEAWEADPALVWAWYQRRRALVQAVQPNAGHHALARWASRADVGVVTQNVDDLHERAGSSDVIHLHGSLFACRCDMCERPHSVAVIDPDGDRLTPPECECGGQVRPGVVWFGEELPHNAFAEATARATGCDVFVLVGTSGVVYPAAGLAHTARDAGATVIEINPQETELSEVCDITIRSTAATALPAIAGTASG
ncbi:NAD-dependent deacylase [Williamsia sp. CHRR-6]|uniref:SIR2 family NAD-dependent protein deacylase n=1 Tax=Williamsia sp. CHRR-6 TaxID=2835871 RepID=UPI001BDAEE85|nr:NAD-dependent deacylase [Williamsia sp. CHRR-6]MBT0566054.1 NAD-dependent deacylase [Williamsia sp. CHRR-6]